MTDLIVLGAGGSAGAIVELVEALNAGGEKFRLRGFLDDDPTRHGSRRFGIEVLGGMEKAASLDAHFIVGVASHHRPYSRVTIAGRSGVEKERFVTLVHPLASISPRAAIGAGVLIFAFCAVSDGSRVEDHAYLSSFSFVGHDATVGRGATMAPRASLHGGSRLGPCAYAGSHSAVREGVSVGEGAVVGMGSIVMREVAPRITVIGNPARQLIGRVTPGP
jgi:sugar O-acyltransferase (sialic acid O-acetyltransferase NeuD family)